MISYVFLNGCFSEALSDLRLLPNQVISKVTQKGISLTIPKDCVMINPIRLHYFYQRQHQLNSSLHNTILAEENSRVTIFEEHTSDSATENITDITTDIEAKKNSCIQYCKIQNENITSIHTANISVDLKENSSLKTFFADFGGRKVTESLRVNLLETRAACEMTGFYLLKEDNQQLDNIIYVNHAAAHGASTMLYKGILDNKSQAGFKGRVHVHQNAQHIHAKQDNHNLLLSKNAEVGTKPELEIYANDVKCTHGATVGQIDEDSLFYLCARGIEKTDAISLLLRAFAQEVFDKIGHGAFKQQVMLTAGYHDE